MHHLAGPVGAETGRWMLDRLVATAVRYGHPFAIVQLRLHHPDAVEPVADRVAMALRGADVLVGWAPDDLIALLPDTDREGLVRASERIRAAVGDLPIEMGGAHWAGDTGDDLLDRAERALAFQLRG